MTRTNSNSIPNHNLNQFITWGKTVRSSAHTIAANLKTASLATLTIAIAALPLSTVGCSSDNPKSISTLTPMTQPVVSQPVAPTPSVVASTTHKTARKRRPANVTYTDKSSGVSFKFPRRFGLKTGEDAGALVSSIPLPMNFVQPGGIALAAVELPDSAYNSNNLAAAFFNVSVNKTLTAGQCSQFSASSAVTPDAADSTGTGNPLKLMVGDLDLLSTETLASVNNLVSDGKYFHVFQNGTCYEFAMQVATGGENSVANLKPVDRDQIFSRLQKVLATVKIAALAQDTNAVAATTPSNSVEPTPSQ